jgi:magnesium-transporting ATPase (P-type)
MMSVVAEDTESGKYYVYSKGAPEQIFKKCVNVSMDFQSSLTDLTLQGFRVLSLAYKMTEGPLLDRET